MSEKKFAKKLKEDPVMALVYSGFFGAIASKLYDYVIYADFAQATLPSIDTLQKVAGATIIFFVMLVLVMAGLIVMYAIFSR